MLLISSGERVSCAASPCFQGVIHGAVAQLGERLHGMQEVVGSSPIGSTSEPAIWRVQCFLAPGHECGA
jgi:hypothetical protein